MKRVALVLCCLAVLCVSQAAAQQGEGKQPAAVDVTGTWKAQVDLGGNTGEPVFTFKQDGDKLTGKYKGFFGEKDVTGKVTGDKIEFEFSTEDRKSTRLNSSH